MPRCAFKGMTACLPGCAQPGYSLRPWLLLRWWFVQRLRKVFNSAFVSEQSATCMHTLVFAGAPDARFCDLASRRAQALQ